ncbi:MAG TPA: DinB family protein [Acidimicrobiales bacterium]
MERREPDLVGDEATLLGQFLDYFRATIVRKAEGLTKEQLAHRIEPSTLTLGGLLKHLALVEDSWFQERLLGRDLGEPWASVDWDATPDWDFDSAVDDEPEALVAMYTAACERSRQAVAEVGDLDAMTSRPNRRGEHMSLRWVLIHMIEETARHAGHADLLRETLDGVTGD